MCHHKALKLRDEVEWRTDAMKYHDERISDFKLQLKNMKATNQDLQRKVEAGAHGELVEFHTDGSYVDTYAVTAYGTLDTHPTVIKGMVKRPFVPYDKASENKSEALKDPIGAKHNSNPRAKYINEQIEIQALS